MCHPIVDPPAEIRTNSAQGLAEAKLEACVALDDLASAHFMPSEAGGKVQLGIIPHRPCSPYSPGFPTPRLPQDPQRCMGVGAWVCDPGCTQCSVFPSGLSQILSNINLRRAFQRGVRMRSDKMHIAEKSWWEAGREKGCQEGWKQSGARVAT